MAAIGGGNLTLLDLAKRTDPNGAPARIVEMLTRKNPVLLDMIWKEGNLPTGERVSARTGLPSVANGSLAWRRLNEGVTPGKTLTDQFDETCGELSGQSNVDVELAKLNGNEASYRQTEDAGFIQAMSNEISTGVFYHSTKLNPERFMGLAPRFDDTTKVAGSQIIKAMDGLSGHATASGNDQNSAWIIGWGDETVYGIVPKGSQVGLYADDMGKQLVDDGTGKRFRAWVTYWVWKAGLVVKDWRYVVRIANIDTSGFTGAGTEIIDALINGVNQMQDLTSCTPVIYVNRRVNAYLRRQAQSAVKQSTLTLEKVGAYFLPHFDGIPIRVTDALTGTEAVVS
jgi:hypothetical protein